MKSWTWRSSSLPSGFAAAARAVLLGAALLGFAGAADAEPRYGRVVIDTTPIAESGAGQLAENLRPMLAPGVSRALAGLADARDRRAPTVVVTVKSFTLGMYGGAEDHSNRHGFGGGSSTDYLDTVVTVQDGRQVLQQFPLLITQPSSTGGPWYLQDQENRRVQKLGDVLGYWLRQKLQG